MKSKTWKIFDWILNILLIIFGVVIIYIFLARILGHSPTDFQVIVLIFGFFTTAVFKIFGLVYALNREVGELKVGIGEIKEKIQDIKDNMNKLIRRRK